MNVQVSIKESNSKTVRESGPYTTLGSTENGILKVDVLKCDTSLPDAPSSANKERARRLIRKLFMVKMHNKFKFKSARFQFFFTGDTEQSNWISLPFVS